MSRAPVLGLGPALGFLLASATSLGTAEARSFRVNEVPNGSHRSCETCHETDGGIVFNAFGSDVRSFLVGDGATSGRHVDWAALAGRDSDGDGFTNGQELGDPDGTWRTGDPSPGGVPSAPGDPASVPVGGACGDGQLSPAETCDGDQLRGATCESQNLGSGTLACTAECRLDTSGCDAGGATSNDDGADEAPADGGGCTVAPAMAGAATGVTPPRDERAPTGAPASLVGVAIAVGLAGLRRRARTRGWPAPRRP